MEQILKLDARRKLYDCWLHDVNQKFALTRDAAARGFGDESGKFATPFPGSSKTIVRQTGVGLGKLALAAAMWGIPVAAAAVGAWALAQAQSADAPAPAVVTPPDDLDLRVHWWIEE